MAYRITAATITNFKRISEVRIIPEADAGLLLIAGNNTAGKSSILDALSAIFGGKDALPPDPIRRGEDEAELLAEISAPGRPTLRIERVIEKDGDGYSTKLKVIGPDGKIAAPQRVLSEIFGGRALDPLSFLFDHPSKQRARLLEVIDADQKLAKLEENYKSAYDRRHSLGLQVKHADGEMNRLPPHVSEIPDPVDVGALTAELAGLGEARSSHERTIAAYKTAADNLASREAYAIQLDQGYGTLGERAEKLRAELAEVERRIETGAKLIADTKAEITTLAITRDRAATASGEAQKALAENRELASRIEGSLANANATNKRIAEIEMLNRRRKEAEDTLERMREQYDGETSEIEKIERRKSQILAKAKLPVEGLSFDAEQILLHGLPFAQASGAQRLQVAIGVAAAASPDLADIWVRDAAILDDDQMRVLAEFAESNDRRVWAEIIRPQDGAIVISDGRVIDDGRGS